MPSPKVSTFTCPNCSAPLQVPPELTDIRCQYCGNPIHIERTTKAAARMPASLNVVHIDPNAGKAVGWIIAISIGLPILIPLVIGLVALVGPTLRGHLLSLPATCAANETLVISGKTYDGKGPAIVTEVNCTLTIENSHIKSDVVVKGGQNLTLNIVNSTLEGSDTALELSESAKVHISGKSEIKGKNGIVGGLDDDITITDSKITADETAIKAEESLKIQATNASITGKVTAIDGTLNLTVNGQGLTLDGGETAMKATTNGHLILSKKSHVVSKKGLAVECNLNLEVKLDDSSIEGGETAIQAPENLDFSAVNKSRVHATGTVIDTETNAHLTVDDSLIEGGETALSARLNANVKVLKGGRITATKVAIDGHENLEIDVRAGTIDSAGIAVKGMSNPVIRVTKKGTIRGGAAAFALDVRPNVFEVSDATITGAQTFRKMR